MYSFKEKNRHYRELVDPSHAQADFTLLKASDPTNATVMAAVGCPSKYADQILFALLEVKTREEIVANRRTLAKANEKTTAPKATKAPKVEAPKVEVPKAPKVKAPKVEVPKAPKVKAPKVETPNADEPKEAEKKSQPRKSPSTQPSAGIKSSTKKSK